jgi:hypothetical protein
MEEISAMVALQQAAEEAAAHDERNASHPVYPPRPSEGVSIEKVEQLRLRVMTQFQKTLAYLGK